MTKRTCKAKPEVEVYWFTAAGVLDNEGDRPVDALSGLEGLSALHSEVDCGTEHDESAGSVECPQQHIVYHSSEAVLTNICGNNTNHNDSIFTAADDNGFTEMVATLIISLNEWYETMQCQ